MPYFVSMAPFFDYICFQWIAFVLKHFYYKGPSASRDISQFLMVMMLATFLFFQGIIVPWFIYERDHDCGPIANGKSGWDPLMAYIKQHDFWKFLFFTLTFFPFNWMVLFTIYTFGHFTYNTRTVMSSYSEDKDQEFRQRIKDNGTQLKRLVAKLEF